MIITTIGVEQNNRSQVITIAKDQTEPLVLKEEFASIIAEEGCNAIIIAEGKTITIEVKDDADVTICSLHENSSNITKKGTVGANAKLTWLDIVTEEVHLGIETHLAGEGAETKKLQVLLGKDAEKTEINNLVIHTGNRTTSLITTKGVLGDESNTKYRATIRIEKNAAGCHGHQRSDMLLIGEKARCDALPILEVENDDVTCSHGAAIGQLNEEQIFYLCSRGVDETTAKNIIIMGVLEPIMNEYPEIMREKIMETIKCKLA